MFSFTEDTTNHRQITIKYIPISQLTPAEYNPRTIDPARLEDLKHSIKNDPQFFEVRPCIINNGHGTRKVIIAGNMRYQAAKALGLKEVPCITVHIPREQEEIWNIKDNNNYGRWDTQKTMDMLNEISERGQDMALTGFDDRTIEALLNQKNLLLFKEDTEGNLNQELSRIKTPQSKIGEKYNLGKHTLMCGDATKPEHIEELMGDKKADMIFTDPPYNVNYNNTIDKNSKIKNDRMDEKIFQDFIDKAFQQIAEAAKPGAVIYVCSGYSSYPAFHAGIRNAGLRLIQTLIWEKPCFTMNWSDFRHQYEMVMKGDKPSATQARKARTNKAEAIMYCSKPGAKREFFGTREEADVWKLPRKATSSMIHPTEKPTWLIKKALNLSSRSGDIILDPFAGSGSTLIAAEIAGREARVMELDPRFCDFIRIRYNRYMADRKA